MIGNFQDAGLEGLGKVNQDLGIQQIGLAGMRGGFGKISHPSGVHHGDRDLGCQRVEPTGKGPPVGSGSFQCDLKLGLLGQPQFPKAFRP